MAKKIFKRWLPDPTEFKKRPALNFMSHLLHDPNLFHLNRHSVSGAFFIGLFTAFLPLLGQMPIAALLALICRVNLPIAVALVWISNPITIPPIFYATYELGRWILDSPAATFSVELSWEWLSTEFTKLWQPLVAGSLVCGVVFGGAGYISIQVFWRWHVLRNWEKRRLRRQNKD
jgi:uncharacterized protein